MAGITGLLISRMLKENMKDIVSEIGQAYTFKDPWRATNRSLTIVVPIVANTNGNREYVVLEETNKQIVDYIVSYEVTFYIS